MRPMILLLACSACVIPAEEDEVHEGPHDAELLGVERHEIDPLPDTAPGLPPLQGGALARLSDTRFVAADVEGDRLVLFDTASRQVEVEIPLPERSLPFRIAPDDERFYVTLAGTHEVVAFDAESGQELWSTRACDAPRGIDEDLDVVFVACQGGDVVRLDAADGSVLERAFLGWDADDLRDIVVDDSHLWITRFRAAEVLEVQRVSLLLLDRHRPEVLTNQSAPFAIDRPVRMLPRVAWRAVPYPTGGVLVLHQRHEDRPVSIDEPVAEPGQPAPAAPYGGAGGGSECVGILHSTWTHVDSEGPGSLGPVLPAPALNVDIALDDRGGVLLASGAPSVPDGALNLREGDLSDAFQVGCLPLSSPLLDGRRGQATAVGVDAQGRRVLASRAPFELQVEGDLVDVEPIEDPFPNQREGWLAFHSTTRSGLACASCHPAGRDDHHTWTFEENEVQIRRRTPVFGGVLADTAPYHWDGEFADVGELMADVFVGRMGGHPDLVTDLGSLVSWLDSIAPPARPLAHLSPDAVRSGRALFHDPVVGCADCHSGEALTDNSTVDVGTGGAFQVPTLRGVASRGPWMHDGCAKTLEERFDPLCGGVDHGQIDPLDEVQLADLIAYLRTL